MIRSTFLGLMEALGMDDIYKSIDLNAVLSNVDWNEALKEVDWNEMVKGFNWDQMVDSMCANGPGSEPQMPNSDKAPSDVMQDMDMSKAMGCMKGNMREMMDGDGPDVHDAKNDARKDKIKHGARRY